MRNIGEDSIGETVWAPDRKELDDSGFLPKLPDVYQIELANVCQLRCKMCKGSFLNLFGKRDPFFPFPLVEKMVSRGDFGGTAFLELQFVGEPLLHPEFNQIVDFLKIKTNLLLGLSTNGLLIDKHIDAILKLDFMTISVDSLAMEEYQSLRKGASLEALLEQIEYLITRRKGLEDWPGGSKLKIDLQLIDLRMKGSVKKDFDKLNEKYGSLSFIKVRTAQDCFLTDQYSEEFVAARTEICLNPWMSCSIHSDGTVVPCCFDFAGEIPYGNINDDSLQDIWSDSYRKDHKDSFLYRRYYPLCQKCYMRSPVFLHHQILSNWLGDMYGQKER